MEFEVEFEFPRHLKDKIDTKKLESFNIKEDYYECLDNNLKGKIAVDNSLENHFEVIKAASGDFYDGLSIVEWLQDHIEHRLKKYTKCISKSTNNYFKYMMETYNRQLRQKLREVLDDE